MNPLIKKISKFGYIEFDSTQDLENKIFVVSDNHFDHKNIIRLTGRPFNNINEMNQDMIDNWNSIVPKDGIVINLGDFCWSGDYRRWLELLDKLNGEQIFILGNHDDRKVIEKIEDRFITVRERCEFRFGNFRVVGDHFPQREWGGSYHGVYSISGHIHEKDISDAKSTQLNICVERMDYRPISFLEMSLIFTKQIRDNKTNLKLEDI